MAAAKRLSSQPAREASRKGNGSAVSKSPDLGWLDKPHARTPSERMETATEEERQEAEIVSVAFKQQRRIATNEITRIVPPDAFSSPALGAAFRAIIDADLPADELEQMDALHTAAIRAGLPAEWADELEGGGSMARAKVHAIDNARRILKRHRAHIVAEARDRLRENALDGLDEREAARYADALDILDEKDAAAAIRATIPTSTAMPTWFKPVTVADIEARPLVRRDWFLDQTIKAGDKVEIIGPSKLGKSWFCLALASHLAAGMPFMGIAVPRPRRVLYFNLEIRDEDLQVRFQGEEGNPRSLWDLYGLDPAKRGNLEIVNCRGYGQELRTMLEEGTLPVAGHDIVIIDPRYKLARPNEDENSAMGLAPLLTAFDRLAERGPAVIYIGHDPKGTPGDRSMTDRGAGSSIAARDYDCRITLTPHADFDEDNRLAVVSFSTRSSAAPTDRTICYEHPTIRYERDIEPTPQTQYTKAEKVRAARSDKPPRCVDAVRKILKTEPNGLSKNAIAKRGVAENHGNLSAMREAVEWLAAHGELTSEKGARFNATIYKLTVVNS